MLILVLHCLTNPMAPAVLEEVCFGPNRVIIFLPDLKKKKKINPFLVFSIHSVTFGHLDAYVLNFLFNQPDSLSLILLVL